jgi:hypothetical protein
MLFTASTPDEIHESSKNTVESFLENRLIWDEFNHYKVHGTILGKHPIFNWMKRVEEIHRMKVGDLVKLKSRLEHNLVINRAALRKKPGHPNTAERVSRIEKMEKELGEIKRLLNF